MNKQEEPSNGSNSRALTIRHDETTTGLKVFNLLDERELAQAEIFLKKIIATEKGGIKSVNEGLAILMRAQDLQLPFSGCIEHIHVINGKTGVDIHIIKSLLLRAGVTWECTKDYAPQYEYTDGNTIYYETQLPQYCVRCRTAKEAEAKTTDDVVGVYPLKYFTDLKGTIYNEFQVSNKCVQAINKEHALKIANEGKFPVIRIPARPIDFVTEYKFTRYRQIYGKNITQVSYGKFSYTDAQTADLFTKDNYKKYPKILIAHRAFTFGARDIADDILMGVMEAGELKLVEDMDLSTNDYEIIENNSNDVELSS